MKIKDSKENQFEEIREYLKKPSWKYATSLKKDIEVFSKNTIEDNMFEANVWKNEKIIKFLKKDYLMNIMKPY